jgi:hypothetical protein
MVSDRTRHRASLRSTAINATPSIVRTAILKQTPVGLGPMDTGSVIFGTTPAPPKTKPLFSLYANIASPYCADPSLWCSAAWGFFMTFADDGPRPDRVEAGEVILDIGAEGGSLTIVGTRAPDGWRFRLVRDETTLRALFNAEDREGLEFWHQTDWVQSFESALALLDRYPWHRLYPLQVHPDFRQQVWAAVQQRYDKERGGDPDRLQRSRDRWRRLCHPEAGRPDVVV